MPPYDVGPQTQRQIQQVLDLIKQVLDRHALGVYLYGSSVLGGLQKYSDIDIFVVSGRPTSLPEKETLAKKLLAISNPNHAGLRRHIELTIAVHSQLTPWRYPPVLDFQYGDWMRQEFEKGNLTPWSTGASTDLAILVTQVLLVGKTLAGEPPHKLLDPVPRKDFITAAAGSVGDLAAELETDTRNVLLTLARIWMTVATDTIASKQEAAAWARAKIPHEYRPVMQHAYEVCLGKTEENWGSAKMPIKPCASYMIAEIKKLSALPGLDQPGKSIRIWAHEEP